MAQQRDTSDQTTTRRLWDADFLSHRPPGAKPDSVHAASSDDAYVGITLWRLRPSMADDDRATQVRIMGAKGMEEWTPERISTGTPLMEGEKIRISIESARAGYLYVFNRWLTARGMIGRRSLIFPAQGVHGDKTRVKAGEVVVLPSHDEPSYFEIKPGPMNRIYERYTILISTQPIPEAWLEPGLITMVSEQLEDWESRLRTRVRRLDQPWLAGQAATRAETEALKVGFTQDDPLPQDLYHAEAKPGDPILADVLLNICPSPVTSVPRDPPFGRGIIGNRPSKRVTASSFLVPLQEEAPGYGLYSYILFGSRPEALGSDRWRRYYEAILSFLTIPSADEMSSYLRPEALNITYLPIACSAHELPRDSLQPRAFSFDKARLAAHAMEHQADGRKFYGHSLSNVTTACTLVSNYDYPRAQKLLSALPETHMEGPYVISVAQPLGKTPTLPAEYLYQDLSSVPPELIGLWFREFMAQAQEQQFWKTRSKEQFVLRLRTAIGIVGQQIPDVGSRLTWAFTTVAPPK